MTHSPKISIIIITLNETIRLPNLLNDLKAQTEKNFEVLVVDSNSDDDTVAVANSFSNEFDEFQTIKMSNRGTSLGRNTGAEHASYERLLFLDADVRIKSDFISTLNQQLIKKPRLVAAGLMVAPDGAKFHIRASVWMFNQLIRFTKYWFPTALGACIISTKTVHEHLNGFDETIRLCEDADYAKRASRLFRFSVFPVYVSFDTRRLSSDGFFKTGLMYFHAFFYRLFVGELRNEKFTYDFGHYDDKDSSK